MMRVCALAALVGVLAAPGPAVVAQQQPDLSGEWIFASGTTDGSRDGTTGERPTKSHTYSGAAFNCGRQCRIVHKGSTLTIDQAQLAGGDGSPNPTVTLPLDGKPQTVVDSVNRGNTTETVSRWEGGKLSITGTSYGPPVRQMVWLEKNQLVVVTTSALSGWKTTLRYTKK